MTLKDVISGKVYYIREGEGELRSDVINTAIEALESEDDNLLKEFKKVMHVPGCYICLVKKEDGKFYLKRFQIEQPLLDVDDDTEFEVEQIGDDQKIIYSQQFEESAIVDEKCLPGKDIKAAAHAFLEDQSKLVSLKDAKSRPGTYIGLVRKGGQHYLREFKIESGSFEKIAPDTILTGLPQDSRSFLTLLPSKIIRGCFRGTDIEAAKKAIREDNELVAFEEIQDGVPCMCAIQDDVGNFYLRTFIKKGNQCSKIGFDLPLDWKFLQKIDEMANNVTWAFTERDRCIKVDTNDLETAINAYITAIAVDQEMTPVSDGLRDGTYIKNNMIFKMKDGVRVFVKRINIFVDFDRADPRLLRFYQAVQRLLRTNGDSDNLTKLEKLTPGQRMFVEVRGRNLTDRLSEGFTDHIDVLNLNLVGILGKSPSGHIVLHGVCDVRYISSDPNRIDVRLIPYFVCDYAKIIKQFPFPDREFYFYPNALRQSTTCNAISFKYKGQTFFGTPSFILYMNAEEQLLFLEKTSSIFYMNAGGQLFLYYDPEYLYKMHKADISRSNSALMNRFHFTKDILDPRDLMPKLPTPARSASLTLPR